MEGLNLKFSFLLINLNFKLTLDSAIRKLLHTSETHHSVDINLLFKLKIFMKSQFTSGTSDEILASGLRLLISVKRTLSNNSKKLSNNNKKSKAH